MDGSEVRQLREARGLSLYAMAERIGTTPERLYMIEVGAITTPNEVTRGWLTAMLEEPEASQP